MCVCCVYVCRRVYACVHEGMCVWICVHVCMYACMGTGMCMHIYIYVSVSVPDPASQRQAQVTPSPASAKWPQASSCFPCQSHSISRGDTSPGWRSRLRVLLNTQIVPGLFLVLADSRGRKWIPPLLRNSKFVPSSVTAGKSKCCKGLQNNLQSWTELGFF